MAVPSVVVHARLCRELHELLTDRGSVALVPGGAGVGHCSDLAAHFAEGLLDALGCFHVVLPFPHQFGNVFRVPHSLLQDLGDFGHVHHVGDEIRLLHLNFDLSVDSDNLLLELVGLLLVIVVVRLIVFFVTVVLVALLIHDLVVSEVLGLLG